jgi:hypothetical protein
MIARRFIGSAAVLAIAAVCVLAANPWSGKPFDQWTAAEVRKILNNSPWAKPAHVPHYPYLNGDKPEVGAQLKVGKVPADSLAPPEDADTLARKPDATVVVCWNSSQTVRHALYRDAILRGVPQAEAAERFLNSAQDSIEFAMVGAGSLLPPSEPSSLVPETYLQLLPSDRKVPAVAAYVSEPIDSRGTHGYTFRFPRALTDGSATISRETSRVLFVCRMGVRVFRAQFKTSEMIGRDGVDVR